LLLEEAWERAGGTLASLLLEEAAERVGGGGALRAGGRRGTGPGATVGDCVGDCVGGAGVNLLGRVHVLRSLAALSPAALLSFFTSFSSTSSSTAVLAHLLLEEAAERAGGTLASLLLEEAEERVGGGGGAGGRMGTGPGATVGDCVGGARVDCPKEMRHNLKRSPATLHLAAARQSL